jgi:hypothetical protein
MRDVSRWRGIKAMVTDAVEHGSRAVEILQKQGAARPFAMLEAIPALAAPAGLVRAVHDYAVTTTHEGIRFVNQVVGGLLDGVLDTVEQAPPAGNGAHEDPR